MPFAYRIFLALGVKVHAAKHKGKDSRTIITKVMATNINLFELKHFV